MRLVQGILCRGSRIADHSRMVSFKGWRGTFRSKRVHTEIVPEGHNTCILSQGCTYELLCKSLHLLTPSIHACGHTETFQLTRLNKWAVKQPPSVIRRVGPLGLCTSCMFIGVPFRPVVLNKRQWRSPSISSIPFSAVLQNYVKIIRDYAKAICKCHSTGSVPCRSHASETWPIPHGCIFTCTWWMELPCFKICQQVWAGRIFWGNVRFLPNSKHLWQFWDNAKSGMQ